MAEILLDLETTGVLAANAAPLEKQPHITEIYMESGSEVFHELIKPPVPIPDAVVKITNITNDMVAGAPRFIDICPDLKRFCLGAERWVAHNIDFDKTVLIHELRRISQQYSFPWPLEDYCTLKAARAIPAHKRPNKTNLGELYYFITGEKLENAHRAENDVAALRVVYDWVRDYE
jgi:DNA polymerase-3 subunit epsilon